MCLEIGFPVSSPACREMIGKPALYTIRTTSWTHRQVRRTRCPKEGYARSPATICREEEAMNANIRITLVIIVALVVVFLGAGHALSSLGSKTPAAASNYAELLTE